MFWACVRTQPQRERVAQHFLGLYGYETYLPRVRDVRHSTVDASRYGRRCFRAISLLRLPLLGGRRVGRLE
jgi:hypothetical protein